MPDREKVLKGLEHCIARYIDGLCDDCPYMGELDKSYMIPMKCKEIIMRDALALLKEQPQKDKPNQTVINLNDWIKVKLTDYGKDIYREYQTRIAIALRHTSIKVDVNPKIDADGYTRFQLWNYIEIYGNHTSMGEEPVIMPLNIIKDN